MYICLMQNEEGINCMRTGADIGGEFGIFCSYFQNSFSIACLRERNPSAKQEKYLS